MRERAGVLPNIAAIGYATLGHLAGLTLLTGDSVLVVACGVLLTAHTMVIAAYLIHEAAHYTLFRDARHNRVAGEIMAWICGAAYASFERIRHMHLRHHRDRADVTVFDYKALLRRHPVLRTIVFAAEWLHVPAVELVMHAQLLVRPFVRRQERARRARVLVVAATRVALFATLFAFSPLALAGYALAYWLLLTTLNFFDAFHHTFDQYFTNDEHAVVPLNGRGRAYEQANTYSNVVSTRHPWLNLLTLNFGYHNAHHERAAIPWYRLPALHRELFGDDSRELLPLAELLRTFHRNRLKRVLDDDYGAVGTGPGRADGFVGAHGVSFLTVV
ncbi:MAG: fatty acid desaturase [Betaproteobacteria bacterium]|nr:fatty acid desaturase [Betaproteobacteria bacterium]